MHALNIIFQIGIVLTVIVFPLFRRKGKEHKRRINKETGELAVNEKGVLEHYNNRPIDNQFIE